LLVIADLGRLNRVIRLGLGVAAATLAVIVAVSGAGGAIVDAIGGAGRTVLVVVAAAVALAMLVSAATGVSPDRTFGGWRVRLGAADYTGRFVAWLAAGGRLVLLSLGAAVAAVLFLPIQWWEGVLGWCILALFVAAIRAHVRVVIEDFDDYRPAAAPEAGSDKENGKRSESGRKDPGAAVLLANRLAAMRDLYGFVDDPDRTPTPDRPTRATVQLEDPSSVLRSAVTTESTVSFGGFSIPLGAVMGLLGRLVQAPRLRGTIHGDEDGTLVTAELVVNGEPYAWRVPKDGDTARRRGRPLKELIDDELAYQVFSDLTLQRQARWPATRYWLLALERMAECQRRPRNRRLLLKEAESNYRRALAEDQGFYLACLNLGIVYRRLAELELDAERRQGAERRHKLKLSEDGGKRIKRSEQYMLAARGVFQRAVEMAPDRWEAYHALADAHWETYVAHRNTDPRSGDSLETIRGLCIRALSREPDHAARARIYDLQGAAETEVAKKLGGNPEAQAEAFKKALDTRRDSCRLVMSELARARLRRVSPMQASRLRTLENLASQCLLNLARTAREADPVEPAGGGKWRRRWRFRVGWGMAKLAVYLADVDAAAHKRFAAFAYENGKLEIAEEEFNAAARIAPADPSYAAELAFVLAQRDRERAFDACERAERLIDFADTGQGDAQRCLIDAYRAVRETTRASELEKRTQLAGKLDGLVENGRYDVRGLQELLESCEREGGDWEAARVRVELGRLILDDIPLQPGSLEPCLEQRRKRAEDLFREALEWFQGRRPSDKRLAELHGWVAQALARRPADRDEALHQAETAMILAPLHPDHRNTLACVYEVGGDLQSACVAADDAVRLDPDDARLHQRAAVLNWRLAELVADPVEHTKARQEASERFEETLKLYASDQREERRTTSWWLARSYFAMSEFERVAPHLLFVLASIASGKEATRQDRGLRAATELWLAKTYRKLGNYGEARRHAGQAVDVARAIRDEGTVPTDCMTGAVSDDDWPLWITLALAHLQLTGSHTDRGGSIRRATSSLAAAREVFVWAERAGVDFRASDIYGEYLAEMGRTLLATDRTAAAITALRGSVDVDPDEADVYLLLAYAHTRAAEQDIQAGWQAHIRDGRAACRHTRDIGGEAHPDTREAEKIEKVLDLLEAEATRRSTSWSTDGEVPGRTPRDGLMRRATPGHA
jgi:tetratricopeptide (TPR) repeat protein